MAKRIIHADMTHSLMIFTLFNKFSFFSSLQAKLVKENNPHSHRNIKLFKFPAKISSISDYWNAHSVFGLISNLFFANKINNHVTCIIYGIYYLRVYYIEFIIKS